MLSKLRKGVNNIFVKLLLCSVVLSFTGITASSILLGNSKRNVIKFSQTESIGLESFLAAKAKEVHSIQLNNNILLTEKQVKELNIDTQILQRLINDSMMNFLAKVYNFEITDQLVINYIKKMPYFKNRDGNFDLRLFQTILLNSKKTENEYLDQFKKALIKSSLLNIFMESFKVPKIIINNTINYLAETKYFDIISIDLDKKPNIPFSSLLQKKDLEDFYNKNHQSFFVPESRSFDYIMLDKDSLAKKVSIEEKEIKDYYNVNKNEFNNKAYALAKKEVLQILKSIKVEDLINKIFKSLEEDVEAGLSLKEIAIKQDAKIFRVDAISKDKVLSDSKLNSFQIADCLFEMKTLEVSYPIEILGQNKVILLELKKIIKSRQKKFKEVKIQISSILQAELVAKENIKILEQIRKDYGVNKVNLELFKNKGILVENNRFITRDNSFAEEKITRKLKLSLLSTKINHNTDIFRDNTKAYFAFVKSSKVNTNKVKRIRDTSLLQITNTIRKGVIEDLVDYLSKQNNIKVKDITKLSFNREYDLKMQD